MGIPLLSWLFLISICLLSINFCIPAVCGQCLDNQQSLLLQLKDSLVFDRASSTKLVHWNQSVDCCSWEGVTCNEGRVIGLNLTNESISGGFDSSSSLFNLQYLQHLGLAFNNFSNQIPSQFDRLTNLSYLNLSNACFKGQIPIAISHLTRLVTLDLSTMRYCSHYSRIKLENPNLNMLVQNLSELTELYLDGVNISAQGSEWGTALSSSLPTLRVLSLSNCQLSGPIDSSLTNLQSLSIIRLNDNDFYGPVPESFANFKNLRSLILSDCWLNGTFPEKIFHIPTLQTLDLSFNYDLQGSLPEFPSNGSLRTLQLIFTNFSGTLPHSIGNLKILSVIGLTSCNFSGSIPSFSLNKKLTRIQLQGNDLTGQITSIQWEELLDLEVLDLSYNNLEGPIPVSLFLLPSLRDLKLSNNLFSGRLHELPTVSSYLLEHLDLSYNILEGPIHMSVFEFPSLESLSLSWNNFSGPLQLNVIQNLINLSYLDLSHNNLGLASSKLKPFPQFLINQSSLSHLDLSHNQIQGEIPNLIWNLPHLHSLNLSYNYLETLDLPLLNMSSMQSLDLRSNQLQGQLSIFPKYAMYLDFSKNNFTFVIPASIGDALSKAYFFSLSRNKVYGTIPVSICNATNLRVLDLSDNFLSGTILHCLFKMCGGQVSLNRGLGVLNLRKNNLIGTISNTFPSNCSLQILSLNGNQLKGKLPKSLARCTSLKVLDLGNNYIEDAFPCYLKNISMLCILVLRSNKFYGPIDCRGCNASWPKLQIVDLAANNFTGKLPIKQFSDWKAITDDKNEDESQLNPLQFRRYYGPLHVYERMAKNAIEPIVDIGYTDAITITMKGHEAKLEKIQTMFNSLDFSRNNFDGPIPEEVGELKLLHLLNLSHNAFIGQIPQSLGKLSNLESLDLSRNELTGKIPFQLAEGLTFLSVLDLSFNQLVGEIPQIKQFGTFLETSYEGNIGLCGFPLEKKCTHEKSRLSPPTFEETHSNSGISIDWCFISVELGFVFGLGIVIGPLMFWKRWRICYYKHVDDIFFKMFPRLYIRIENRKRQVHRNQGQRAHQNQGRRH